MVAAVSGTTEAFARVKINALRIDAGWDLTDGVSALFEHALPDNTQADYVLCDRQGRPMAALETRRASTDPITAQDQGRHYAEQPDAVHDTLRDVGMTGVVDADAAQLGPLADPKPEGVEQRRREVFRKTCASPSRRGSAARTATVSGPSHRVRGLVFDV